MRLLLAARSGDPLAALRRRWSMDVFLGAGRCAFFVVRSARRLRSRAPAPNAAPPTTTGRRPTNCGFSPELSTRRMTSRIATPFSAGSTTCSTANTPTAAGHSRAPRATATPATSPSTTTPWSASWSSSARWPATTGTPSSMATAAARPLLRAGVGVPDRHDERQRQSPRHQPHAGARRRGAAALGAVLRDRHERAAPARSRRQAPGQLRGPERRAAERLRLVQRLAAAASREGLSSLAGPAGTSETV